MSQRNRFWVAAILALITILACRFGSLPMREPAAATPGESEAGPTTEAAPPGPTRTPFPQACDEDQACFLEAAASCSPATVTWVVELNMLGAVTTNRTYL